jgi:hypothetical protein
VGGGFFWLPDLLIGCFDFILDLCIFLKMVRCQFMSGGQKTPLLHPIRMATALFAFSLFFGILETIKLKKFID